MLCLQFPESCDSAPVKLKVDCLLHCFVSASQGQVVAVVLVVLMVVVFAAQLATVAVQLSTQSLTSEAVPFEAVVPEFEFSGFGSQAVAY